MKNIQIILNAILSQDVFEYILIDKAYQITDLSENVTRYFGETVHRGDDIRDYLPEIVGYEDRIETVLEDEKSRYVLETVYKNDYYIDIHLEHYSKDKVLILLHNTTEITLSKLELLQYSNENQLLFNTIKKILDSQNNLLVVTSNNKIEYANKKFLEYFSLKSLDELKERNENNFSITSLPVSSFDALYEYAKEEEKELTIGEDTFLVKATLLEKTYKLFTFSKITKLCDINRVLEEKINRDPLTGLYRKSFFDEKLAEALAYDQSVTLVIADIDNFKTINDRYGHLVGDRALREFADLVSSQLRDNDLFARWGGEEFLMLFNCSKQEEVVERIESIRETVDKHVFDGVGHLTVSFGVATSKENDTVYSLLERADKALYLAKKKGKNMVVVG